MIEREKRFWKGKSKKINRDSRCRWEEKGEGSAVLSNPGFAKIRIGGKLRRTQINIFNRRNNFKGEPTVKPVPVVYPKAQPVAL